MNEREEQCKPYDIRIRRQDTGEVVSHVEVKATASWDKTYFEVGSQGGGVVDWERTQGVNLIPGEGLNGRSERQLKLGG